MWQGEKGWQREEGEVRGGVWEGRVCGEGRSVW